MPDRAAASLNERIAGLSPEKRALLERRLRQRRPAEGVAPAIPRREATGPAPLSHAQQRLWFLDQLEEKSALYNVPLAVRVRGELDVEALRRALDAIVRRHETLRTIFALSGDQPVQVIADEGTAALE